MAKLQIRSAYIHTFPQCILYKKTYARCRRKQTFHIRRCAFNSKNSMHLRHSRGGIPEINSVEGVPSVTGREIPSAATKATLKAGRV